VKQTITATVRELSRLTGVVAELSERLAKVEVFSRDTSDDLRDVEESVPEIRRQLDVIEERLDARDGRP
jgi:chromosome segregation ATPase